MTNTKHDVEVDTVIKDLTQQGFEVVHRKIRTQKQLREKIALPKPTSPKIAIVWDLLADSPLFAEFIKNYLRQAIDAERETIQLTDSEKLNFLSSNVHLLKRRPKKIPENSGPVEWYPSPSKPSRQYLIFVAESLMLEARKNEDSPTERRSSK